MKGGSRVVYSTGLMNKIALKKAFTLSIPVLFSYGFASIAYGILMNEIGIAWYISMLISFIVYTGAFQYVLIPFLASGTSLITVALTGFLMSSRQTFYAFSFVDVFKKMKQRCLYLNPSQNTPSSTGRG